MAAIDNKNYNNNDDPITSLEQDKLDRKGKVENIVKCIADESGNTKRENSYVIAILGEWGSGKSSIINLVKEKMAQNRDTKEIEIININPLHFGNKYDLNQVMYELIVKPDKSKGFIWWLFICMCILFINSIPCVQFLIDWIKDNFTQLLLIIIILCLSNKNVSKQLNICIIRLSNNFLIKRIMYLYNGDYTALENIKEYDDDKLHKRLKNRTENRKILVIIDDIDRLKPKEINKVFDLVKGIWNIPRITYLLAFDYDVVTKALRKVHNYSGKKYLQKFIQHQQILDSPVTVERVEGALKEAGFISNDNTIPDDIITKVADYVPNLRILKQIARQMQRDYKKIKDDLVWSDILLITLVGVMDIKTFNKIKDNRDKLFRLPSDSEGNYFHDQEKMKDILNAMDIPQLVHPIIENMFICDEKEQQKFNSISIQFYFSCYFNFTLDKYLVSKKELNELEELSNDREELYLKIKQLMDDKDQKQQSNYNSTKWFSILVCVIADEISMLQNSEYNTSKFENYFFNFAAIYKEKKLHLDNTQTENITLAKEEYKETGYRIFVFTKKIVEGFTKILEYIVKGDPDKNALRNMSRKDYKKITFVNYGNNDLPLVNIFTHIVGQECFSDGNLRDNITGLRDYLFEKYQDIVHDEKDEQKPPD